MTPLIAVAANDRQYLSTALTSESTRGGNDPLLIEPAQRGHSRMTREAQASRRRQRNAILLDSLVAGRHEMVHAAVLVPPAGVAAAISR